METIHLELCHSSNYLWKRLQLTKRQKMDLERNETRFKKLFQPTPFLSFCTTFFRFLFLLLLLLLPLSNADQSRPITDMICSPMLIAQHAKGRALRVGYVVCFCPRDWKLVGTTDRKVRNRTQIYEIANVRVRTFLGERRVYIECEKGSDTIAWVFVFAYSCNALGIALLQLGNLITY